ncbi:MAG: GDP-mannose 4,6-dehydratase [Herpetosiphonaceae bacterium]|nr:GDP-mannose 4,6-dehydratase [Herpetosiphonaceae bacterium]
MDNKHHMERVLVTGATGLLGGWLVRALLERECSVVVLVRDPEPQSELYRSGLIQRTHIVVGQLEEYAVVARAINEYEVDTVFHLGAQTIVGHARRSPLQTFESNIRGTWNLLEACRLHPAMVRAIVVASSDKAYGDQATLPYTEQMPLQGRYPYDVSKSCTDLITQSYYATYQLPVAIARCGNIYGGGDLNWSRIVPGTIRSLLQHQAPVIRSNGRLKRDYVYVQDVVQAYLLLAEAINDDQVRGEAFNFSLQQPLRVDEMVWLIMKLFGTTEVEPMILNQAVAEIVDQYLDSTKARSRLGWRPTYSLEAGLRETISWYQAFLSGAAA